MEMDERKKGVSALLVLVLLLSGFSLVSAASPAKLVSGFISNGLSAIFKLLWSMASTKKTVISGRPMMKFENGYTVETVFDGSKLGIEPFSVEVLPGGQLLVLDSMNSNIYRISLPLSRCLSMVGISNFFGGGISDFFGVGNVSVSYDKMRRYQNVSHDKICCDTIWKQLSKCLKLQEENTRASEECRFRERMSDVENQKAA
ncbi:hypothetical protein MA16_Dca013570 [Dendrobium catenatum]|uniref:Uncharacterized protein n=1 Tax=Dendrobium catenatum TaxID=906689 RepID=A0A2I0VPU4_9ASPA|nr:hypothetical protein MA16_Dca013570 [Dendrobium catenatum]